MKTVLTVAGALLSSALTGPLLPGIVLLARGDQYRPRAANSQRMMTAPHREWAGVASAMEEQPEWRASVAAAMKGRRGTAVVVDRESGRVLAQYESEMGRSAVAPGSVMKPLALWALMAGGKVTDRDAFPCPGPLRIGTHNMSCAHPAIPQAMTVQTAIAYSCNNFVAHYAARFDDGEFAAFLHRRGIGVASDAAGVERRQLQALGEADVRITPVELARAYARMAQNAPAAVLEGLRAATEYGTARLANAEGLSGKTGTADGRAWFAGFTANAAIAVVVPGGSGGVDAAPLAKQIVAPGGVWVRMASNEPPRYLTLEEYVTSVLAGECTGFQSDEALKAMAVAIRTYAVRFRGQHRKQGFDLCNTTHCQLVRLEAVTSRDRAAAEATAHELLWHGGEVATAYYSQDCGGITEAAVSVWPDEDQIYLQGRADTYCLRTGRALWSAVIGQRELAEALRAAGLRTPGKIESVDMDEKTSSGRAQSISLSGGGETVRVAASSFRFAVGRKLGWNIVKSLFFRVRRNGDRFVFEGYGAGHGVGLCQKGADQMGSAGKDYREILAFYFPGAKVGRLARGLDWRHLEGERVEVVTTQPGRDQHLVKAADEALRHAEDLTGLKMRVRPLVRVYPTVAAFRDGTGESGNVAGDTRGRVIRLQPNCSNQTMVHEMLHFVVEGNARADAPRQVREGVVAYLAGDERVPDRVRRMIAESGAGGVLASITRSR